MHKLREWTESLFLSTDRLPITFFYAGQRIRGIPEDWLPQVRRQRVDANILTSTFTGKYPENDVDIRVVIQEYLDFPVVEWTAWFSNPGEKTSRLLSDVLAIDCEFNGDHPVLTHCNGDFYHESGYTNTVTELTTGETLRFAPTGGRPCDQAFPYYRLVFSDCGLTLAIGWPGQWVAGFQGTTDGTTVQAGQETVSLNLLPGECIRTPRITLMAWKGDETRAINLWRRWYLAHVLPRPDGKPLRPRLAVCGPEEGEEFTATTEENQLENIEKFARQGIDFDVWWIDAGWYPCYDEHGERKWWITGSWEPDPERFPDGLKTISQKAEEHGADLLVWFEPERVRPGTRLDRERPEWLLHSDEDATGNRLLYLGNPEARNWLTEHVCNLIRENGIKIYRQDFNFEPLSHWRIGDRLETNDHLERQGYHENQHVQGYLQYWDELLRRNPGLWIDSCSSGGRRNDMETMRRSVPLHFTDYGYGIHSIKLAFHRTLFEWIPYFKEATLSWDTTGIQRFDPEIDSFSYHCGMAPMLFATIDIRKEDYDFPLARKLVNLWHQAADLILNGDFYALTMGETLTIGETLTPTHRSEQEWVAWQFDLPELGKGLVQGIRLKDCEKETLTVSLHGLDSDSRYRFENPESGEVREVSGEMLQNQGFLFQLPRRNAAIWFYNLIN